MTFPRLLLLTALLLFGSIGFISLFTGSKTTTETPLPLPPPVLVSLPPPPSAPPAPPPPPPAPAPVKKGVPQTELPEADRVEELFRKEDPKFPIVETITYKSRASWQKNRPAWLSDYASHHKTSRHFIARSLNGTKDYTKQEVKEGDRFNVLRQEPPFEFYLVVDTSLCKMWLYYVDLETKTKTLIKTYAVSLGRLDPSRTSGLLTPHGQFLLGDRIALFKPKATGTHQGKKVEMITVFGTRWIPFEKEVGSCTEPAKGFGIHGVPWERIDAQTIKEQEGTLGRYESDGCIRLKTEDMEELFAIIISRPTVIEIVPNFFDAHKW